MKKGNMIKEEVDFLKSLYKYIGAVVSREFNKRDLIEKQELFKKQQTRDDIIFGFFLGLFFVWFIYIIYLFSIN